MPVRIDKALPSPASSVRALARAHARARKGLPTDYRTGGLLVDTVKPRASLESHREHARARARARAGARQGIEIQNGHPLLEGFLKPPAMPVVADIPGASR